MSAQLFLNPRVDRTGAYPFPDILSLDGARQAMQRIAQWPGYAPTPLLTLTDLAKAADVAAILYKQEGERFGLGSFKALGGAYAIERLVERRGGVEGLVVTSATDGNHGRSVAWGAQRLGIRCIIYVHATVSQGRADAIAEYGADVRRVPGNYDDAVRAAAKTADENGWVVVSDTSWPGYEDIPKDVMQGYAVMAMEADAQDARPTHVFVQGGVGGLAASVLAYRWEKYGTARPMLSVVEPVNAACLLASARNNRLSVIGGELDTIMAGLACGEPSMLAWRILDRGADAFMAIPDSAAAHAMRVLADRGIVAGESGVSGLAGFSAVAQSPELRTALRINQQSRILCYGTEGATDTDVYARIVGRSAEDVKR